MKLYAFIDEFRDLELEDRLEALIELSDDLPRLSPARHKAPFPKECRIQECMTPVHLWVDVLDDRVKLEADVPRNSPTVRGLLAIVVQGLSGCHVDEVRHVPDDLLEQLGLVEAIGLTRQNAFRSILRHIRSQLPGRSK